MAILLGLDPGSHRLGWGVIEVKGRRHEHVAHGVCTAPARADLGSRLLRIYEGLLEVVDRHGPETAGLEGVFAARNVQSALVLGHARGMILLALAQRAVPVTEYAPSTIKSSVGGHGQGTKGQVATMVARLLGVDLAGIEADASDALAVAICHAHERSRRQLVARARGDR